MNKTIRNVLKVITFLFNGSLVVIGLLGFYTLISDFDVFGLWLSILFFVGGLISIIYVDSVSKDIKKIPQPKTPVKKKRR